MDLQTVSFLYVNLSKIYNKNYGIRSIRLKKIASSSLAHKQLKQWYGNLGYVKLYKSIFC